MTAGAVAGRMAEVAGRDRGAGERADTAPILIGAMFGALVAGRLETAAIALGVAGIAVMHSGACLPRRGVFAVVIAGALLSLALNLYLVSGPAIGDQSIFGNFFKNWRRDFVT